MYSKAKDNFWVKNTSNLVADPGSSAFLTPGSGINNPDPQHWCGQQFRILRYFVIGMSKLGYLFRNFPNREGAVYFLEFFFIVFHIPYRAVY
jgi:hypothetical protein